MNQNIFSRHSFILIALGFLLGLVVMSFFGSGNEPASSAGSPQKEMAQETTWTCSMHPQIRQPKPGKCPICFMDLIPVAQSGSSDHPRTLEMSESSKKLAQIQTAPVERRYEEHELRLIGKVEFDETRLSYITARIAGRLDRLFVDYTGTPIKKGEHLAEIYSPELIADQEALLQALRAAGGARNASGDVVQNSRTQFLRTARERLRLLGLTEEQIAEIEQQETPSVHILIRSPIDGIVIEKSKLEGEYVEVGDPIYSIADLTQIWVKMDAYESDLPWIHYGQPVEFTTLAYPGEIFRGRIAFIDPVMDPDTRTVKVRVNVDNRSGKLKPNLFVNAIVRTKITEAGRVMNEELAGKWICPMHPEIIKDESGNCDLCGMPLVPSESLGYVSDKNQPAQPPLVVPASAVLVTGERAIVYVAVPNAERPTFQGREIVLGPKLGNFYAVQSGLQEGDQVVANGAFKIDSALQLEAKPSMMSPVIDEPTTPAGPPQSATAEQAPAIHASPEVLSALLKPYQSISKALAGDDLAAAQAAAQELEQTAQQQNQPPVVQAAQTLRQASEMEAARAAFYTLSQILIQTVRMHGAPQEPLYLAYCPMAFDNKGGQWLQWDKPILNPYFGSVMLQCGEIQETFEAKSGQTAPTDSGGHSH